MERVECLYRVSTKGQVDHDDIPMQRIECRKFAESQGWIIIKERQMTAMRSKNCVMMQLINDLISCWCLCSTG